MQKRCEDPKEAMDRFWKWVRDISKAGIVEGVVDTAIFDGGRVDLSFGQNTSMSSPFGYTGLDLDSFYRGWTGREDANLRELGLTDKRSKLHRADQDAHFLAQIAHELLFKRLCW